MRRPLLLLLLLLGLTGAGNASARSLVVYCSHDPDACELAAQTFRIPVRFGDEDVLV